MLALLALLPGFPASPRAAGFDEPGRAHAAEAGQCSWTRVDAPDPAVGVRTPVQFDTHAAYAFYLFALSASQGRLALRLEGSFPYAAYTGLMIYDGATGYLEAALVDHEFEPDGGSGNPFVPGTPVNTPDRAYTVVLRPHGTDASDHPEFANQMEMPVATGSQRRRALDLWLRIYGPNEGKDRLGGVALPKITAFDWETLKPVGCPQRRAVPPDYSPSLDGAGPSPDCETGRIDFTRPPAYGTSPLASDSCETALGTDSLLVHTE